MRKPWSAKRPRKRIGTKEKVEKEVKTIEEEPEEEAEEEEENLKAKQPYQHRARIRRGA